MLTQCCFDVGSLSSAQHRLDIGSKSRTSMIKLNPDWIRTDAAYYVLDCFIREIQVLSSEDNRQIVCGYHPSALLIKKIKRPPVV